MVFGGHYLNIRDVCMDFEPCFKVYHLVSAYPRSIKLGQKWQVLRLQDRIEVCLAEIAFARHVETISLESVVFSRVK